MYEVIAIGLASWRCAAYLSYERGPFAIFQELRNHLGFEHDFEGKITSWPDNEVGRLISCVWCLSIWFAIALYGVWQIAPAVVMVLAAAALVPIVERWVRP